MNNELNTILTGDWIEQLKTLPDNSVHCIVTSPPYWGLRDYGVTGQLGLESTPELYIAKMVEGFEQCRRVLRHDGTCWVNIGDSYWGGKGKSAQAWTTNHTDRNTINGSQHQITGMNETRPQDGKHENIKPKDLVGIPWMLAFALRSSGWWLRQEIIWHKPNPMPESCTDRCTKAHESIFLLTKSQHYYFDAEAIKEPVSENYAADKRPHGVLRQHFYENSKYVQAGMIEAGIGEFPTHERAEKRNKRSVWTVPSSPFSDAHFATFPEDLIVDCIQAGTSEYGCCPTCAAPWERITEKVGFKQFKNGHQNKARQIIIEQRGESSLNTSMHTRNGMDVLETTGWHPTCQCPPLEGDGSASAKPGGGIVLDPFFGAGTTGLVARKLHRNFIGIELNPKYIAMANKRLKKELGLFHPEIINNG